MARIGLIAGNGKFPFLALQGARDLGHEVTIVAIAVRRTRGSSNGGESRRIWR